MDNQPLKVLISALLSSQQFKTIVELQEELRVRGYGLTIETVEGLVRGLEELKNAPAIEAVLNPEEANSLNSALAIEVVEFTPDPGSDSDSFIISDLFEEPFWDFDEIDEDFFNRDASAEVVQRSLDDREIRGISDPEIILANAKLLGFQGYDIQRYAQHFGTLECFLAIQEMVAEGLGLDWGINPELTPDLWRQLNQ